MQDPSQTLSDERWFEDLRARVQEAQQALLASPVMFAAAMDGIDPSCVESLTEAETDQLVEQFQQKMTQQ